MNLTSVFRLTEDAHLLTRSSVPWHNVLLTRIDIVLGRDRDCMSACALKEKDELT